MKKKKSDLAETRQVGKKKKITMKTLLEELLNTTCMSRETPQQRTTSGRKCLSSYQKKMFFVVDVVVGYEQAPIRNIN